jgi:Tfp pilus assembly protein PilN
VENQNIIEPKNLPMWTAAGLIVSILALAMAVTGMYRSSAAAVISQAQVLLLNQKIEALSAKLNPKPAPATAAAKP